MRTKSPSLISSRLSAYYGFTGVDRSRPVIGMDDGKKQPLFELHNGHAKWTGTLVRDAGLKLRTRVEEGEVIHQDFFNRTGLGYAVQTGKAINLYSERSPASFEDAFTVNQPVSSVMFAGQLIFTSAGFPMIMTDGFSFKKNTSQINPGFGVAIEGRLYVAGVPSTPAKVEVSKVFVNNGDENISEPDQAVTTAADRADFIDLSNVIGTADEITGLARFETNRLAIFTNDQCVVFKVDPDVSNWEIDSRANVQLGAVSHNAIAQVGSDIIFCSRHGVHSLIRSSENGITIDTLTLSYEIENLYKEFLRACIGPRFVTCTYDQDLGRLHIFFPMADGNHKQLVAEFRRGYDALTWASSDAGAARCGAFLAGSMTFGTTFAIYDRLDELIQLNPLDDVTDDFIRPQLMIKTPILWHGQIDELKESRALVVQAAGNGSVQITAYDEEGQEVLTEIIHIERRDDNPTGFPSDSLDLQFRIPFQLRYRGLQLQFESQDMGDVEILGFAIELKTPAK